MRSSLFGVPLGVLAMAIVAGVNLANVLLALDRGTDPFGYANATILALLWAIGMVLDTTRRHGSAEP